MKRIFNKVSAKLRQGWGKLRGRQNLAALEEQKDRALEQLRGKATNLEKYIYLSELQERNERLFYYTALKNIDEIMPLIYTPTVGEACQKYSKIFRSLRGLHITPDDKGKIRELLDSWPESDVRAIVITDGQRILGLGDLGANGMGIPIGKLALYTLCGGIDPRQCMPVMFDVGTNNDILRHDPAYLGYPHKRLTGKDYDALMEEFIVAVNDRFPKAVIQFEDFQTANAYKLLETYRDKTSCFNDDIQGTAAVILAGIYAAAKATDQDFKDMRIMLMGAGAASTGIADLVVKGFEDAGLSREEALKKVWMVDSKGLVTQNRATIERHKKPYAQNHAPAALLEAIHDLKPQILIGATGTPGTFTREIIEAMTILNKQPVIFALSNPTTHSECTAEEAYTWSQGRALFASGSPFGPVAYNGKIFQSGQGNNAYIFPGLALGAIACEATRITDEMFLAAAKALADMVTADDLKWGTLYPPLKNIRQASSRIASAVIEVAVEQDVAGIVPKDIEMYDPSYAPFAKKKRFPPFGL